LTGIVADESRVDIGRQEYLFYSWGSTRAPGSGA
jgi:hypothetical protein